VPLPQLAKSWQFDVNQVYNRETEDTDTSMYRKILWGIKESLVSTLGERAEMDSSWTVTQSSGGAGEDVTAGPSDHWTAEADLTWPSGESGHSWIVLAQPGITTDSQICIDLDGTTSPDVTIIWAPNGFESDGTTTARPTATVEVELLSGALDGGGADDGPMVVHAMQSTDGQCTRVIGYRDQVPVLFWLFDRARNTVANWNTPAALLAMGDPASNLQYARLQSPATPSLRGYGSALMHLFMSTESFGATMGGVGSQFEGPNDFDLNWPLTPIGLACLDDGHRGRHGEIADLWFASSGARLSVGRHDGARRHQSADQLTLASVGSRSVQKGQGHGEPRWVGCRLQWAVCNACRRRRHRERHALD
jgi:hypothetical protein